MRTLLHTVYENCTKPLAVGRLTMCTQMCAVCVCGVCRAMLVVYMLIKWMLRGATCVVVASLVSLCRSLCICICVGTRPAHALGNCACIILVCVYSEWYPFDPFSARLPHAESSPEFHDVFARSFVHSLGQYSISSSAVTHRGVERLRTNWTRILYLDDRARLCPEYNRRNCVCVFTLENASNIQHIRHARTLRISFMRAVDGCFQCAFVQTQSQCEHVYAWVRRACSQNKSATLCHANNWLADICVGNGRFVCSPWCLDRVVGLLELIIP